MTESPEPEPAVEPQSAPTVPPDMAQAIIAFLDRTPIQGSEAMALVMAQATMRAIVDRG